MSGSNSSARLAPAWRCSAGRAEGLQHFTLAFDADLTKTRTAIGEAQHVAGGAEASLFSNRFEVRGGLSRNIAEPSGTSVSTGLSFAMRRVCRWTAPTRGGATGRAQDGI